MKITLKNNELAPAINFLESMTLKANKDSRHRTKLVKQIREAFKELSDEEKALMEKFSLLDENGQLKDGDDQDAKDVAGFNKEQAILMEEEVVIEGGMYARNFDEIPRILKDYDGMLSGKDAEVYDRLLDEFEKKDAE
ncbi:MULTISPECIES: DUF1617 family protein [unclassified Enterococcus]|uniref:DUF1617 family protein n=1 Tax=unclassified Enterococcus TaxID=2608891 RepID=UPI0019050AFD|nr:MULTISPECIES: DUF1617 family protein [unclassified Enterococcus]MBK0036670.1 DUF1617 family protein [Enterococcus sp. S52]MBK0069333.1 DUF1617 family protein [Enterococcus sp. S53]MBK0139926.1 DUF1617 family protein [Enterococcus sp. S76]MBK0143615.1 DUF1617 family protein [Enterococcus sp. S77]